MEWVREDGNWQEALQAYQTQREDLEAGRKPRGNKGGDVLTVADVCNRFRTHELHLLDSGEITART